MNCPLCDYLMDPFDSECRRCHGKGLPNALQQQATQAKPEPVAIELAPPPVAEQPDPPAHYSRFCPHCGARMAVTMQYCPTCRKKNTLPADTPAPARPVLGKSMRYGAVLLFLLLVGFWGYRHWTRTPQYSLLQARAAVTAHDMARFEKYVDIDGIVGGYIDDAMAEVSAQQAKVTQASDNPWKNAGEQMAKGLVAMLKPTITNFLKTQIRNFIETGDIENQGTGQQANLSLTGIQDKMQEQGVDFDGIGYVKQEGSIALVGIQFINQKDTSKSFVIELKMRWVEDHWQVSRWNNAVAVMKQFEGKEPPQQVADSPLGPTDAKSAEVAATPPQDTIQPQEAAASGDGQAQYVQLTNGIVGRLKDEIRNFATASEAYEAGNTAALRQAALEGLDQVQQDLTKLNLQVVPTGFDTANTDLRQGLIYAQESFDHWATFAETGNRAERATAMSRMDSAINLVGQALKERDRLKA